MLDLIKELVLKNKKKGFLAGKVTLECPNCGRTRISTYYDLLKDSHFELMPPTTVPNPYIQESYYEEEVTVIPIKFRMECPDCDGEMAAFSSVPLEYLVNMLGSPPPDDIMYG